MTKAIKNWKFYLIVTALPVLIALQPAVTFACGIGNGGHCGG